MANSIQRTLENSKYPCGAGTPRQLSKSGCI